MSTDELPRTTDSAPPPACPLTRLLTRLRLLDRLRSDERILEEVARAVPRSGARPHVRFLAEYAEATPVGAAKEGVGPLEVGDVALLVLVRKVQLDQ